MDLPERVVMSRRELVAAGFDDEELRRAPQRRAVASSAGRYTTCPPPRDPLARHAAVVRTAFAAWALADGRSESVGESRSRVAIRHAGLPAPVLRWEVADVGRVDLGRPALCTVGEFDGLVKYGRLLKPGREAADAVVAEKIREDALRAEILGVARWIRREIDPFTAVAARLRRQFDLGTSHGLSGARTFR